MVVWSITTCVIVSTLLACGAGEPDITTGQHAIIGVESIITASDGLSGDQLGHAIAVSGDTMVVGAHLDNHVASDAGAA